MSIFDQVKANFPEDVSNHSMEVNLDSGISRHLVFSNDKSFNMYFGLVTWDDHLCYYGDMGTFVFQRVTDMFCFFRSKEGRINPSYWAEKLQASDRVDGYREYSKALFEEAVKSEFEEWEFDSAEQRSEVWEDLESQVLSMAEFEVEAHHAATDYESEYGHKFSDFWEHDLNQFTYRYLWACYAIAWGISEYDKFKSEPTGYTSAQAKAEGVPTND